MFRFFADRRQPEVFMALTLLVALGIAWLTAAAGLSMALGAFLAGLLMAETEYRHEVEVMVEPFKGLLMGLFFMAVGMGIDLGEVTRQPGWIVLSVLGLFAIKAAVVAVLLRVGGFGWGSAAESDLLLGQGGEFAFVIVGYAMTVGLLSPPVGQFMMLVVGFNLLATTAAARLGQWLRVRWDRVPGELSDAESRVPQGLSGHIVIAGFGRVGQLSADVLERQGIRYLAVEQDAGVAAAQRRAGRPVFYGNAARTELLQRLHMADAAALLITMDQPAEAMHTVRSVRQAFPALPIYARSRDEVHAHELRAAGATGVVPETLEAGLQLCAFALGAAGLGEADVAAQISGERQQRT